MYSEFKRIEMRQDFAQCFLEPSPFFLDRIKVWRIGRKEKNGAIIQPGEVWQLGFSMESSVVEDDHAAGLGCFEQAVFEPPFEEFAVSRAGVFDGSDPLPQANPSAEIRTLELLPADFRHHFFAPRRIGILAVQKLVYAAFVHIYKAFWR